MSENREKPLTARRVDEIFQEAMNERRRMRNMGKNDHVIGCPLCMVTPLTELEKAQLALDDAERAVAVRDQHLCRQRS